MRVWAIVTARGGSKGIPGKNIRDFSGKPLLYWTIEVAKQAGVFEKIFLSTDDPKIAELGKVYGAIVPGLRPESLATDQSPTAPVIHHVLNDWRGADELPEYVVVLEPTSPLRRVEHLRDAMDILKEKSPDSLVSVNLVPHHDHPEKILRRAEGGEVSLYQGGGLGKKHQSRHGLKPLYAINGILYASKTKFLFMEPPTLYGASVYSMLVDKISAVDIDEEDDWLLAETLFKARNIKERLSYGN